MEYQETINILDFLQTVWQYSQAQIDVPNVQTLLKTGPCH